MVDRSLREGPFSRQLVEDRRSRDGLRTKLLLVWGEQGIIQYIAHPVRRGKGIVQERMAKDTSKEIIATTISV